MYTLYYMEYRITRQSHEGHMHIAFHTKLTLTPLECRYILLTKLVQRLLVYMEAGINAKTCTRNEETPSTKYHVKAPVQ